MAPPSPTPTASPPATGRRSVVLGVLGVLVLAAAAVVTGLWLARPTAQGKDDPAVVYDHVRDRILAGDGDAIWPLLIPAARAGYADGIRELRVGRNAFLKTQAADFRRKAGLSLEDFNSLPPEKILARESLAAAEDLFRGSRVYQVDMLGPDVAVLHISFRNGEKAWILRRVGGAWKIENLLALLNKDGVLLRRPEDPPFPAKTATIVR